MTRIGFIGNFFGELPDNTSFPDCDIYVIIGSLCKPYLDEGIESVRVERQTKWIKESFNNWLEKLYQHTQHIIVVPGIYDTGCYANEGNIQYHINATYLSNELTTICGLKIFGSPYSPYIEKPKNLSYIHQDAKLKDLYASISPNIDILITYCPPYKILDEGRFLNKKCENLGSRSLKSVLDSKILPRLRIHAFSHSEKDCGKTLIQDQLTFVNVSPLEVIILDI